MSLPKDKPDAILAPRPFLPNGRPPHAIFNALFGRIWDVPRVQAGAHAWGYFIHVQPDASLVFPTMHHLASKERYDWYVVQEDKDSPPLAVPRKVESFRDEPQAIRFGYLRDEDDVDPPSSQDKADYMKAVQNFQLDYETKVKRRSELLNKAATGASDAAEAEELEELGRYFKNMAENGPPDFLKS